MEPPSTSLISKKARSPSLLPHTDTQGLRSWLLPSKPPCHHTPQQLLAHEMQKADANLVNTLWVFQPGKVHLLHVTGADSTSAAWNGGRWPRGHSVPTEHWDVPCGQEPHGLRSQPERQQPQLTHSEHGQGSRGTNHRTKSRGSSDRCKCTPSSYGPARWWPQTKPR